MSASRPRRGRRHRRIPGVGRRARRLRGGARRRQRRRDGAPAGRQPARRDAAAKPAARRLRRLGRQRESAPPARGRDASCAPDWVLFLDVDERIDGDDARALREFIGSDALPGIAYGLELYRQWERQVVTEPTHVYRLFSPGSRTRVAGGAAALQPCPGADSALGMAADDDPRASSRFATAASSCGARSTVRPTLKAAMPSSARRCSRRRRGRFANGRRARRGSRCWRRAGRDPTPAARSVRPRQTTGHRRHRSPTPRARSSSACLRRATAPAICPRTWRRQGPSSTRSLLSTTAAPTTPASLLEASDAVRRVLRNPPRPSYAGWDDARNRQQLLEAAIELGARWVLFLDADERIDADDFAALRLFVERDAVPGSAYGFRVHRMVGDGGDYDRAGLWVYRLFAAEVGQRLAEGEARTWFRCPSRFRASRWEKTTVRIQHLAGVDEGRRRERLLKYEQADPELRWQSEYAALDPRARTRCAPGSGDRPHLPVLADPAQSGLALDLEELDLEAPLLSAIMIARDDAATIERSVRAVVEQECSWSFETIVVVSGSPRTAAVVRELFDEEVTLVELAEPALPGKARNAGLARARGEYVSFPGSHVELAPGSLAHRIRAHEAGLGDGHGLDLQRQPDAGRLGVLLPRPLERAAGPSVRRARGRPRSLLLRPRVPARGRRLSRARSRRRGHDRQRGALAPWPSRLSRARDRARPPQPLLDAGAGWSAITSSAVVPSGASCAATSSPSGAAARLGCCASCVRYPGRRLASTERASRDWGGELRDEYRRVRHLVVLGVAAAWVGTCFELALPRPKSAAAQATPTASRGRAHAAAGRGRSLARQRACLRRPRAEARLSPETTRAGPARRSAPASARSQSRGSTSQVTVRIPARRATAIRPGDESA